MFYHFLFPIRESISGFNIFQYITFRSAGATITALAISFLIGPFIIRKIKEKQIGEMIRVDGPESHHGKAGTPTMGGLIILVASLVPTILWARLDNKYIILILFATVWMGFIGFLDDYFKVIKKIPKGLIARYKLAGQISLGLIIGSVLYFFSPELQGIESVSTLPFFKDYEINFGVFYIPIVILVITGTSNAVNLTDGLDGLAIGVAAISFAAFAGMCYITGRVDFSDYLNIIYLKDAGELTVYCSAMFGASLGFLWYNAYPAEIFMGDTGSLALGSALGTVAILVKKELLLVIVGGVFVVEVLSVILQRLYFKYTKRKTGQGKRIFKMTPLHHHFEEHENPPDSLISPKKPWNESKIVIRFWILAILFALLSLSTFKIR